MCTPSFFTSFRRAWNTYVSSEKQIYLHDNALYILLFVLSTFRSFSLLTNNIPLQCVSCSLGISSMRLNGYTGLTYCISRALYVHTLTVMFCGRFNFANFTISCEQLENKSLANLVGRVHSSSFWVHFLAYKAPIDTR